MRIKSGSRFFFPFVPQFVFTSLGLVVLGIFFLQFPLIQWPVMGLLGSSTIIGLLVSFFQNRKQLPWLHGLNVFILCINLILIPQVQFFIAFLMAVYLFYLRIKTNFKISLLSLVCFSVSHLITGYWHQKLSIDFFVTHYVLVTSLVFIFLSADDVSEYIDYNQKENRFLSEVLKTFFNASPVGLLVIDLDQQMIRLVNEWFLNCFPVKTNDPESFTKLKEILNLNFSSEHGPYLVNVNLNGKNRIWQLSQFSISNTIYLVMVADVTETENERQNKEQEKRLAVLGSMVASIAHEIRNPLAGIIGGIEVILDPDQTQETRNKFALLIRQQTDRLQQLLTDILDYAKSEKLDVQSVDLGKLILETWEFLKNDSRFGFLQDHPAPQVVPNKWVIKGDSQKLKQVLMNLIINACEAILLRSPDIPRIEIQLNQSATGIKLTIRDNGIGIDKDVLDRLFEPFFTTKKKGTGLGLALVKKILDAHGAKIWVTSEKSLFTQVDIEFPTIQKSA